MTSVNIFAVRGKQVPQKNLRYANSLRCIGQTLEGMDLKAVEVKIHEDTFIVQAWHKGQAHAQDFERQYAPEDIKNIEAEGRARRKAVAPPPNLLSLSHMLRFAGNYIDRMRGRLIRVSWQVQSEKIHSITIQYESVLNERGEPVESQVATIEEICMHIYKQKKSVFGGGFDKSAHRSVLGPSHND